MPPFSRDSVCQQLRLSDHFSTTHLGAAASPALWISGVQTRPLQDLQVPPTYGHQPTGRSGLR
ncbi:hypothetical protein APTSU1_000847600 [Apodemus speciosus]|uniref:Uncharacterized protein n=1 Tax=Apodemus speciosus TaxID=105296 RepID=A0ABQ0F1U6_APOSI